MIPSKLAEGPRPAAGFLLAAQAPGRLPTPTTGPRGCACAPGPRYLHAGKEKGLQTYLEQAFGKGDVTTPRMRAALREWLDLYYGAPRPGEDPAPRLAALIVGKLCRTVFAEYEPRLEGGGPMLAQSLASLNAVGRTAVQYALIGGECLLKPVPGPGGFDFVPIRRDCYAPLARDAHGRLLAVGTMESLSAGGVQYALLERRTAGAQGLTIETRLFERNGQALGRCVPLPTLECCADLVPQLFLPGVPGLGLAVLRTPLANCVDGGTDPVSIYAPAVGLLHALARCEQQLDTEFENGASRVFASEDLLRPDARGNRESLLGLRRGILSETEAEAQPRTATEIAATAVDYDLTIRDLQAMWADAARQALDLCAALGGLYGLGSGQAPGTLAIDWGDGVLYDRARVWEEQRQLVADGLLRPEHALGWYFGLPHRTEADLQNIRQQLMPKGETNHG